MLSMLLCSQSNGAYFQENGKYSHRTHHKYVDTQTCTSIMALNPQEVLPQDIGGLNAGITFSYKSISDIRATKPGLQPQFNSPPKGLELYVNKLSS